mmetsp:Transcript_16394/g.35675  ORF Transcript_16394/g.35675 Transcript_16394/m.35675 type:complete len:401 (-) Transcript_16394:2688-3890(-)|eukprot:CAMPEP_0168177702 /NCGR_PEP_ID=MMETSP0139_2-20121125/8626_1 /TAXON_ID=44445 /ORGANISM="Pseudo-nitzschia australis, Strain 10249 10 AB" /LENGTH=400 /DNA_ID=CAMNT_0008096833 /DNA_START=138 /DNA_END=1340 /DNA_ORIENTATION=+
MSAVSSSGGGEQWAWLGLLKWTLAHTDGTRPSSESPTMMSDEDKAFLEKVMSEGVIDECERMKFILQEFSKAMDYYYYKSQSQQKEQATTEEKEQDPPAAPNEDDLEELLQELRDIVEQIDYARGFVNLKGCQYLLGAINASSSSSCSSAPVVPSEIRNMCLGILSTLAQNNPPVQKELVELGAIKILSDIFLLDASVTATTAAAATTMATPLSTKIKIMQALSAIVRCYDLTETIFEHLPQAPLMMVQGLSSDPAVSNSSLRTKTLFFMRAFLTSDNSTPARANKFRHSIAMIADTDSLYLNVNVHDKVDGGSDYIAIQLRESTISILQQLLERRLAVTLLLQRKQHLASLGVQRIQQLRSAKGEEAESAKVELQNWESFLILLARAEPEEEPTPKLLL